MNKLNKIKLAVSSLMIGAGVLAVPPAAMAERSSPDQTALSRAAAKSADGARKALAKHKFEKAVTLAERAVAAMPRAAEYRLLLGEAYLSVGRFNAAETSFADTLALSPANPTAALKLALVKTANGRAGEAQSILDAHKSILPVADYGLALALAGDPQAAVLALEQTVRDGQATPKTRQNLALSYALAGRWLDARAMATRDLPADLADKRIVEWASLARPSNSWEQVATILGVARKSDDGQPTALALVDYPEQKYAAAAPEIQAPLPAVETAPQPNYEVSPEVKDPAPVRFAAAPEAPVIAAPAEPIKQQVVAISAPASKAAKAPTPVESGRFVVQLGAYKSAGVAANGWAQVSKRWDFLNEYDARQAKVNLAKGTFYRLSVSGFETRSAANEVCSKIKAEGGQCFIRSILPSYGVRWAANGSKKAQQLASR